MANDAWGEAEARSREAGHHFKNRDGKIQRDEWNEYYAAVSSSIDNDDHFVQLMRAAWKLD